MRQSLIFLSFITYFPNLLLLPIFVICFSNFFKPPHRSHPLPNPTPHAHTEAYLCNDSPSFQQSHDRWKDKTHHPALTATGWETGMPSIVPLIQ